MASSFVINLSRVTSAPEAALRDEILGHTGCDAQADSILRGIERLGRDASIAHYEMTRMDNRPAYRGERPVSWSVRAVRR